MNDVTQITLFERKPEESALTAIPGLVYHEDFITSDLEQSLISHIDLQPWDMAWQRRVQQYGSSYGKSRPSQAPIPQWLTALCERLAGDGFFSEIPNQIIINEYQPGQGIAPHSDYLTSGNIVASLSLGAPIVMDFISPDNKKLSHLLSQRSLFVLSGVARYDWKHGIAGRQKDVYEGVVIPRQRRISCTFRNAIAPVSL